MSLVLSLVGIPWAIRLGLIAPELSWKSILFFVCLYGAAFVCICAFHFFRAPYLAYRDLLKQLETERASWQSRLVTLERSLEQARSHKPDLQGNIDLVHVSDSEGPVERHSRLIMIVSISNLGTPSIVHDVVLSIDIMGNGDFKIFTPSHPSGAVIMEMNNAKRSFNPDEMLYVKTAHPISTGDRATGPLVFVLPISVRTHLEKALATMTLLCRDVTNKQYQMAFNPLVNELPPVSFIPGMNLQVVETDNQTETPILPRPRRRSGKKRR